MNSSLKKQILKNIKPSKEEHEIFEKIVLKLKRKLKKSAKSLNYKCDFFIGGSFGKNTYLKGTSDVDIFCKFDLKYDDSKLSDYLKEILDETKLKYKKQKGSRDYYTLVFGPRNKKIIFEIIPNRNIKSINDMLNSTDVSPLHVKFLNQKAQENLTLTDEIRLAKQFFKSKGLYGAESYINGFSGHVIDILITYYGSLENLLSSVKSWRENEILIDINHSYESLEDAKELISEDKHSSLIVIDPIIKDRNAARALSSDNFNEFVLIANMIEKISLEDFEISKPELNEVISDVKSFSKKNNLKYLMYNFKFETKENSEDIIGSKLLKLHKKLIKFYESYDFKIFHQDFYIDMEKKVCLFILLFEKINLPNIKIIYGPKVYMKDAIKKFLIDKERSFIEKGRVCVYEKRVINKIEEISDLNINDLEEMLGKDLNFVKKVKLLK